MSLSAALMLFGIIACVLIVVYLAKKTEVDAWIARVRSTKGAQTIITEVSAVETEALARWRSRGDREHIEPPEPWPRPGTPNPAVPASIADTSPPSVAPSPPVAASSGDGGTEWLAANAAANNLTVQPMQGGIPPQPGTPAGATPGQPLSLKESIMDKGVASAGELLSGWVLANYETKTDPVPAKRHADLMYLTQMARKPGGNQVFEDVLLGSQESINVARNYAHTNGWDPLVTYAPDGGFKNWAKEADPDIVAAAVASILAYQTAHPRNVHTYDFGRYVPKV